MLDKHSDQLKARLSKIKALAERGVGGEKATAQKKLDRLLAQNDMTLSDLEENQVNYYLFSYQYSYRERLLGQCIYRVLGAENFHVYKSKGTRNKLGAYCTPAQKLEIDLDFEFYANLFDEELDILMVAFIDKQDLYPDDAPDPTRLDPKDLSDDELSKLRKRAEYSNTIDKRARASALLEDKRK